MTNRPLKTLALAAALLLAASAATADERPRLYAEIEKRADGRYYVTELSTDKRRIDFLTLEPVGFDQRKWDCSKVLFRSYAFSDHRECVPEGSEFRRPLTRTMPTMLLGVTTLGASLAMGIIVEESVFDEDAYLKSVEEAIVNSGLKDRREEIRRRFTAVSGLMEEQDEELQELYRKYRDGYYNSPSVELDRRILDASGLYRGELHAEVIMRVDKRPVTEMRPSRGAALSLTAPPEEFEARLKEIEAGLMGERESYEEALRESTSHYAVLCGPESMPPYRLSYDCPARVAAGDWAMPIAKATVVSRDIEEALPRELRTEDANIAMTLRGSRLTIENRSKREVSVTRAALSYMGRKAVSAKAVTIAPGARAEAAYDLMTPEIKKAAQFKGMTMKAAEAVEVELSVGLDYSIGPEGLTLESGRSYRLSELINMDSPLKIKPTALP